MPVASARSQGGLSGCFAEGVTSNTSDSESSSSKCAPLLLSHLRVCVCVLSSRPVPVAFLFGGWSFLLVTPRCCGQLPSQGSGASLAGSPGSLGRAELVADFPAHRGPVLGNGQVLGLKHEWLPEPEPVSEHLGPAAGSAPVSPSRSSEYPQHTHWLCLPKSERAVEGRERGGQLQN